MENKYVTNGNVDAKSDVMLVSRISIVPVILELLCRTTGMGFVAVARVTPEQWIACGVHDEINFGLKVGGELKVDTTICHEIRQSDRPVVIDHVTEDELYRNHHTPAMYGFQSYISVPLKLNENNFFGTLCAIDPHPSILNTREIVEMFKTFSLLIAMHIHARRQLTAEQAAILEDKTNAILRHELDTLTASPNLKDKHSKEFAALLNACTAIVQQQVNELQIYLS